MQHTWDWHAFSACQVHPLPLDTVTAHATPTSVCCWPAHEPVVWHGVQHSQYATLCPPPPPGPPCPHHAAVLRCCQCRHSLFMHPAQSELICGNLCPHAMLIMLLCCAAASARHTRLCIQHSRVYPAATPARMLCLPYCYPALLPVPAGVRPSAPPLTLTRHAVQALRAPPASAQTHHVGLPAQCIMSTCLVPNPKEHMSANHDTVEQYS